MSSSKFKEEVLIMNICFLYGKIVSDIDLKFFYNNKIHNSVVPFVIEVDYKNSTRNLKKQKIFLHAYDENADIIYRKYKKEMFIKIIGETTGKYVIIKEII